MAATAPSIRAARHAEGSEIAVRQTPAKAVLFVTSTDNAGAQQRALDALNRHSGIVCAKFAPDATRLIQVDYRARFTNVTEMINTAQFYAGVRLRSIN